MAYKPGGFQTEGGKKKGVRENNTHWGSDKRIGEEEWGREI